MARRIRHIHPLGGRADSIPLFSAFDPIEKQKVTTKPSYARRGLHSMSRPLPQAVTPIVVPRYRTDALTPEIVDPRIADVEAVARWFDYAFELPGGFRFGLAGIIGLIPGIGDLVDALISLFIIYRAVELRISRVAIARMLVNVGIEALAGAVPFVGDVFDIVFKANRRNYLLLKRHLSDPQSQRRSDWWFLILTVVLVMAGIALPIIGLIVLIKGVFNT
jgi:Domain of unknown function (DUF4112)